MQYNQHYLIDFNFSHEITTAQDITSYANISLR